MRSNIKLGRILGIEIGLHYSWFLIGFLIVISLASYFRSADPSWGENLIWSLSVLTGLLFFVTLLLHELSHALAAKAQNLHVRSITLFALGGVAQIDEGAASAKGEFWMAIVGPITSAVIGGICLGVASSLGWSLSNPAAPPLAAMLGWLGYINIALAAFNMIPGFPLDGGRVLRAILWWRMKNEDRATKQAARAGKVVGILFIVYGILRFFQGAGFNGLWLAFIGWFLVQAAHESYSAVDVRAYLGGVRVGDLMARDCETVSGNDNVQTFVDEHLLRTGRRCFVVEQNGKVAGLITANEVKQVDRPKWPYTTLDDIMRPLDQIRTVSADTPVVEALELMARGDVNQLPVVSGGHLDGIISRAQVLQYFQTRAELKT